jgi:hypothetical protein
MSQIIKKFSQFQSSNGDINEGAFDLLGGLFSKVGDGVIDVAKGYLAEYLYGFFGVKKESLLGRILTNLVETIDLSEYPRFVSGDISTLDLAPKLADASIEVLSETGIDGLASMMKIEDKDGWIYRTIKEMVSNESRKQDFRENLVSFWAWVLGGTSSANRKNPLRQNPLSKKKEPLTITPSDKKKIESDPAVRKSGMSASDILSSLTGGGIGQGKELIGK